MLQHYPLMRAQPHYPPPATVRYSLPLALKPEPEEICSFAMIMLFKSGRIINYYFFAFLAAFFLGFTLTVKRITIILTADNSKFVLFMSFRLHMTNRTFVSIISSIIHYNKQPRKIATKKISLCLLLKWEWAEGVAFLFEVMIITLSYFWE